jgi:hypothetical protein
MVEGVMDVYAVTKVAPTIDGHGFNIIGRGRPVVHFGYEREREAIAASSMSAKRSSKLR